MPHLSFIFTEDSFRVDRPNYDAGEQEGLKQAFLEDRYRALFQLGFEARRRDVSPSFRFFTDNSRELRKRPYQSFGLGTEYITNYDAKDKTIDDYLVSNA